MKCPFCQSSQIKVINTRTTQIGIWRRRQCLLCHQNFSTSEVLSLTGVSVIKRSGKKERFISEKIFLGICHAGNESKRLTGDQIRDIANKITRKLEIEIIRSKTKTIKTRHIGQLLLRQIRPVSLEIFYRFRAYFLSNLHYRQRKASTGDQ